MLFHVPKLFISLWYILGNFFMSAWGTVKWRCLGGSLVLEKRRKSFGLHLLNYSEVPEYRELHLYFIMSLLGALFSGCSLPSIRIFRIIFILLPHEMSPSQRNCQWKSYIKYSIYTNLLFSYHKLIWFRIVYFLHWEVYFQKDIFTLFPEHVKQYLTYSKCSKNIELS